MTGNLHMELGRYAARVLFTVFDLPCELRGRENLPAEPGPYILAMNHGSALDPVLIWAFYPHAVYFVAKEEIHRLPVVGTASRLAGNIAIRRGRMDRAALLKAAGYLTERRRVLGLFVEGTRSSDGELRDPKPGPALLALMTGVPVVPAYLHGTYDVLPRHGWVPRWRGYLSITLGKPVRHERTADFPPKERLREVAAEIGSAIASLRQGLLGPGRCDNLGGPCPAPTPLGDEKLEDEP